MLPPSTEAGIAPARRLVGREAVQRQAVRREGGGAEHEGTRGTIDSKQMLDAVSRSVDLGRQPETFTVIPDGWQSSGTQVAIGSRSIM